MIAIVLTCGETWQFDNADSVLVLYRGCFRPWEIEKVRADSHLAGRWFLHNERGPLKISYSNEVKPIEVPKPKRRKKR